MAAILVIAGGMLGLLGGLVSLFMGLGFLAALTLWCAIGLGSTAIAAAMVILPRRQDFALRA